MNSTDSKYTNYSWLLDSRTTFASLKKNKKSKPFSVSLSNPTHRHLPFTSGWKNILILSHRRTHFTGPKKASRALRQRPTHGRTHGRTGGGRGGIDTLEGGRRRIGASGMLRAGRRMAVRFTCYVARCWPLVRETRTWPPHRRVVATAALAHWGRPVVGLTCAVTNPIQRKTRHGVTWGTKGLCRIRDRRADDDWTSACWRGNLCREFLPTVLHNHRKSISSFASARNHQTHVVDSKRESRALGRSVSRCVRLCVCAKERASVVCVWWLSKFPQISQVSTRHSLAQARSHRSDEHWRQWLRNLINEGRREGAIHIAPFMVRGERAQEGAREGEIERALKAFRWWAQWVTSSAHARVRIYSIRRDWMKQSGVA